MEAFNLFAGKQRKIELLRLGGNAGGGGNVSPCAYREIELFKFRDAIKGRE